MDSPKIAITGFMCSGKTTVARALGQLLGCQVIDLDEAILASEGRRAGEIIETEGEETFRQKETRVLSELLARNSGSVISLGGGTWIVDRNRKLIVEHEYRTVWLDASLELCWKRIQATSVDRPLARSYRAARIRFEARLPGYALADYRIPIVGDEKVEETARKIASLLQDAANS